MLDIESRAVQPCETRCDYEYANANLFALKRMAFVANKKYIQFCEEPKKAIQSMWMGRFPPVWQKAVEGEQGVRVGAEFVRLSRNLFVTSSTDLTFFEQLPNLYYGANDEEFQEYARALAIAGAHYVAQMSDGAFKPINWKKRISDAAIEYGFQFDWSKADNWEECVVHPRFWLTLIREEAAKRIEQYLRELGYTRKARGAYISDISLRDWEFRQRRSFLNLATMEAANDQGEVIPLEEVAKSGVSNPAIRRAELMVRIRGCEEWAEADNEDWVPMFYTITCPSKYHAFSAQSHRPNFKYSGATPSEARDYLQQGWANARKALDRRGVRIFGVRIAEPHHDGCPHWHMLLFVRNQDETVLTEVLRSMAFREDADEKGAAQVRFEVDRVTPDKGSAVGYVAKYVSKNIDGFGVEEDEESGLAATDSAKRVRAWASTWNIRQFQFVGGPEVTVWRELRRMDSKMIADLEDETREFLLEAQVAADTSDWSAYITAMGGISCKRTERPLGLGWAKVHVLNRITGESDSCQNRVRGVYIKVLQLLVKTRQKVWKIRKKASAAQDLVISLYPDEKRIVSREKQNYQELAA